MPSAWRGEEKKNSVKNCRTLNGQPPSGIRIPDSESEGIVTREGRERVNEYMVKHKIRGATAELDGTSVSKSTPLAGSCRRASHCIAQLDLLQRPRRNCVKRVAMLFLDFLALALHCAGEHQ